MAHWSGIGIPKTNAIALEVSYTHTSPLHSELYYDLIFVSERFSFAFNHPRSRVRKGR